MSDKKNNGICSMCGRNHREQTLIDRIQEVLGLMEVLDVKLSAKSLELAEAKRLIGTLMRMNETSLSLGSVVREQARSIEKLNERIVEMSELSEELSNELKTRNALKSV